MTTKLDRDAENFLASVRGVDDPSADDKQRVRAALAATIAAGTVATTASTASAMKGSLAAASATTGLFSLPKIVIGVAILLGGTGLFVVARNGAHPANEHNNSAAPSAAPAAQRTESLPRSGSVLPVVIVPAALPGLSLESAPVATPAHRSTPQGNEHVVSQEVLVPNAPALAPVEAPSTLSEEMRLLREAQEAVRDGHPQDAIRLLDAHEQNFAGGVLANERAVLRARARQLLSTSPTVESDTSSNRSEH